MAEKTLLEELKNLKKINNNPYVLSLTEELKKCALKGESKYVTTDRMSEEVISYFRLQGLKVERRENASIDMANYIFSGW